MNGQLSASDGSDYRRKDLLSLVVATNFATNESIKELKRQGVPVYHLSFGQSPFAVCEALRVALPKHAYRNDYVSTSGIIELREAICTHHRAFPTGFPDSLLSPGNIVVCDGSKMAIYLLMVVTNSVVVLVSPAWDSYPSMVTLAGKKTVTAHTSFEDQWKLTPKALREAIADQVEAHEKMMVILTNPGNPTGQLYTEDEMKKLTEVFREHKMIVLSDEIYSHLTYSDEYVSLAKFYPEGTVVTSGLSKWASAGGWRVGYAMFPPELSSLRDALGSAASHTFSCAAVPQQCAATELLNNPEACGEFMKHTSRILHAVSLMCVKKLVEVGVKVHPSHAGYYTYPDFSNFREKLAKRSIRTGQELCDAIFAETKVSLLPGAILHLEPADALTMRLCYVNFDGSQALEESKRIGLQKELGADFVIKYCKQTVDALEILASWCVEVQNS